MPQGCECSYAGILERRGPADSSDVEGSKEEAPYPSCAPETESHIAHNIRSVPYKRQVNPVKGLRMTENQNELRGRGPLLRRLCT